VGMFLRKMMASFNDLMFQGVSRLFEQLEQYKIVESTASLENKSESENGYRGFISSAQYDAFIIHEASNIEGRIRTIRVKLV